MYQMRGTGPLAGSQGIVTYFPRGGWAFVDLFQLPPPPAGDVYEVWLVSAGGAQPAGVFQPDADGQATVLVHRTLEGVRTVSVTLEPAPRGSAAPTGQPELTATLQ